MHRQMKEQYYFWKIFRYYTFSLFYELIERFFHMLLNKSTFCRSEFKLKMKVAVTDILVRRGPSSKKKDSYRRLYFIYYEFEN